MTCWHEAHPSSADFFFFAPTGQGGASGWILEFHPPMSQAARFLFCATGSQDQGCCVGSVFVALAPDTCPDVFYVVSERGLQPAMQWRQDMPSHVGVAT